MQQKNYVYILLCADNTLYTGWTNSLEERVDTHNNGKGAKYTRARLPVRLVYYETYETPSAAMKRECAIKKLTRRAKLQLIESFQARADSKNLTQNKNHP